MDRDMYDPIAPLPFTPIQGATNIDGWSLAPWKAGERGAVTSG